MIHFISHDITQFHPSFRELNDFILFLLQLSNILLYVRAYLIDTSAIEYLSCFHILVIVKDVAHICQN